MMSTNMMTTKRTYSELITIPSFLDRYLYLKLGGVIGEETFGYERQLNQTLYRSGEWRRFRRDVIIRDKGCDLAHYDYEICDKILVHHIDPITPKDVLSRDPKIFDLENVVCVSLNTHNAIHYGDESLLLLDPIIRVPNDTCPWKRN